MNLNDIIQMIRSGQNPQQLALNMLQNVSNTPMGANLLNLAKSNKTADIEQIARNLVGADFDKQFAAFKNMLGLQ